MSGTIRQAGNPSASAERQNKKATLSSGFSAGNFGRGKRIRTSGPCVPNAVLYQAELFPDTTPQLLVISLNCKVR